MNGDVLGTIIKVVGGAVLGFFARYLIFRVQKSHPRLETLAKTISLVSFKPGGDAPLQLVVDGEAWSGDPRESGKNVEVQHASWHDVRFRNPGHSATSDFDVCISVPNDRRIIDQSTKPEASARRAIQTEIDGTSRNVLRVKVPYLNPKETLRVIFVSGGAIESEKCKIEVDGKEISLLNRRRFLPYAPAMGLIGLALALAITVTEYTPAWLIRAFGAVQVTREVLAWPWWANAIGAALVIVAGLTIIWAFIRASESGIGEDD